MKKHNKNCALNRLQKIFPQVKQVKDSTETIMINVTPSDTKSGRKKDSNNCALVKACIREKIADHAIIGIKSSWLIKGKIATRYLTSVAVGREITSFDRHQDFAEGEDYKLCRVPPHSRMDAPRKRGNKTGPHINKARPLKIHHTSNIRTLKNPK